MKNNIITYVKAVALILLVLTASIYLIRTFMETPTTSTVVVVKEPTTEIGGKESAPTAQDDTKPSPEKQDKPLIIDLPPYQPLQPEYTPINEPEKFKQIRQEGKVYTSSVIGKVEGLAHKQDWGMKGQAYFVYLYGNTTTGKIIKNDGHTIIEERTFSNVVEEVLVSDAEIGLALPAAELGWLATAVALCNTGELCTSLAVGAATEEGIIALNQVNVPVRTSWLNALKKNGLLPNAFDFSNPMQMFFKDDKFHLLEGKTVRITFEDGKGITKLEALGCELTDKERAIIMRSNYIMDHELFPNYDVSPGDKWTIRANVLSGLLDPRMEGKPDGSVEVQRENDGKTPEGDRTKRLRLTNGTMVLKNPKDNSITGQVSIGNGECNIPHKTGVVRTASLSGHANYEEFSKDHLLFKATMSVNPSVEIEYECSVSDN